LNSVIRDTLASLTLNKDSSSKGVRVSARKKNWGAELLPQKCDFEEKTFRGI
jgi:hypothetical protein